MRDPRRYHTGAGDLPGKAESLFAGQIEYRSSYMLKRAGVIEKDDLSPSRQYHVEIAEAPQDPIDVNNRDPHVVGNLLLGQRQLISFPRVDAALLQAVAKLQQERGDTFLGIGPAKPDYPIVQMALVEGELPGKQHGDAEILGGEGASFIVMNSSCRRHCER